MKPGYYWAYDEYRGHDVIVRVSDSGVASDMIVQNTDACSDTVVKQRIPTAEELGEWTDKPRCPDCGADLDIFNDDDGGDFRPLMRCDMCSMDVDFDIRFRVKS